MTTEEPEGPYPAMEDAIQKASVLIEALPYIRSFNKKYVVIKLGGSAMEVEDNLRKVLQDIVFMSQVRMKPIIVHGAGPMISEEMKKEGLTPRFVEGQRYTDEATIKIVERVLTNVNKHIVSVIEEYGFRAKGLIGDEEERLLHGKRKTTGRDGKPLDLGLVGEITWVNDLAISQVFSNYNIAVIAPLATDSDGSLLNVNADIAAAEIAGELKSEKIVFVSDTHGIYRDVNDKNSLLSSMKESEMRDLIDRKIITGGMLPKVHSCMCALKKGVKKAHIIDGQIPHSLLLEIFTEKGIGTEIIRDNMHENAKPGA
ncbi:MAG: acetylglutamate kinase [Planctomycetota bacterium]